jgi:hypothetical protein
MVTIQTTSPPTSPELFPELNACRQIIRMHDSLLGQLAGLVAQASAAGRQVCEVWQQARQDPYDNPQAAMKGVLAGKLQSHAC